MQNVDSVHNWFIKEKSGHVIKHGCQLKIIFSTLLKTTATNISDAGNYI